MAGVIGLRGPDIEKRSALRGYQVVFQDADRPIIRPHTGSPVLFLEDGKPKVDRHVFGFSRKFSSFNARDDKLEEGKMWMGMYGRAGHHGVAPVSYILEWGDIGNGKQPFRIERADGAAMCVPALVGGYWEERGTRAFALVTIAPNDFVATFHDRMIGQLADDQLDLWLRPETHTAAELRKCLAPPANDELVAIPIKADVGSAKFSDASALDAVGKPLLWADVKGKARRDPGASTGGKHAASSLSGKSAASKPPAGAKKASRKITSATAEASPRTKQSSLVEDS